MQGTILALVVVMAFRLDWKRTCLNGEWWEKKQVSVHNNDIMIIYWIFLCLPTVSFPCLSFMCWLFTTEETSQRKMGNEIKHLSFMKSIFHFSLISPRVITSVPALCSCVPSCVLYISWMPIFTATVTFCPTVCPWYAFNICLSCNLFHFLICSFSLIFDCLVGCFFCPVWKEIGVMSHIPKHPKIR